VVRPGGGPRPATLLSGSLALVAAVSFALGPVREALERDTYGFPAYYTSSRLVLEGRWTPDVYDNDWFHERSATLARGVREIYRPNPPMASLIALPVAGLDYGTARRAWLVLQLLAIGGLIVVLRAALPGLRAPPAILAFTALVLAWSPLREDVRLGQVYTFVALLQAVVLLGIVRRGDARAGLALGATIATKVASVPLAIVLAVRGKGRAVGWAGAAVVVGAAATLPFAGVEGWRRFGGIFVDDTFRPGTYLAVHAYQSASGLLTHLFVADPQWNPSPLADAPGLAAALGLAFIAVVLAVTTAVALPGAEIPAIGLALAAGLLVINLAQEYHGAMLVPPVAIALAAWPTGSPWRGRTALLVAALILAGGPFFYRDAMLPGGLADVAWYPRLAGAVLLWVWFVLEIAPARLSSPGVTEG
jgi:hypothetical protein